MVSRFSPRKQFSMSVFEVLMSAIAFATLMLKLYDNNNHKK